MDLFAFLQSVNANFLIYVAAFIVVLSILVFVHEWGHYIVARMFGIKVDTFSIGFGRELFGFNDRAGTRWKVSLIPLGGYVKLFGDVDPASVKHSENTKDETTNEIRPLSDDERKVAFFAKPVWQRALVVFAGPAINYIFAVILLAGLFMAYGRPVTPPIVGAVSAVSSANKAGFLPGDRILSIDGAQIDSFEDLKRAMLLSVGQEHHFRVRRGDEEISLYPSPEIETIEDRLGFKHSRGLLGVYSPGMRLKLSDISSIEGVSYNAESLEDQEQLLNDLRRRLNASFEIGIREFDPETGEESGERLVIITPLALENTLRQSSENPDEPIVLNLFVNESRTFIEYSPVGAFIGAVDQTIEITINTVQALSQIITGSRSVKELGGVIRIGTVAGDMAKQGLVSLIFFTALLSINLGFINLLPVPILDGGHLVFYAVEAVQGQPVSEQVQEYAFRAGFVFLISLVVFTNINDILQLLL